MIDFLKDNAGLLGSVVGILVTFYLGIKKTLKLDSDARWRRTLRGNSKIKPLLKEFVVEENPSCRVILKFLENGGGVPHVGAQLFSSAIAEANNSGLADYTDNWQRVRASTTYTELLHEVALSEEVFIEDVEDMSEGQEKDHYITLGAKGVTIHHVKGTKKKWYYLEEIHCEETESTPEHRERVRVLKQDLEKLLR